MADLSTITLADVTNGVVDVPGGDPLGNNNWQAGQRTGQTWPGDTHWVCNALQWIYDNTPYEIRGTFEFRMNGVYWSAKIIRQSDGTVLRQLPMNQVTGHIASTSDPYKQVIEMMRRAAVNVANFANS